MQDRLRLETLKHCPLCGSLRINEELRAADFQIELGVYSLFKCQDCTVKFTNPRPIDEDLPKIYRTREQGMDLADRSFLSFRLKKLKLTRYVKRLIRLIGKDKFSLLDYGCGDGLITLVFAEKKECRQAWCADFALQPPALFTMGHSSKVVYLPFDELNKAKKKFDVIILRHVLEHTPWPKEIIRNLQENYLLPAGMIIFEVPNIDSIWFKIFKGKYNQLGFPQHLIHFTRKSLQLNFPGCEICNADIPVLGPSITLAMGRRVSNIGVIAALFYMLQIIIDKLFSNNNAFLVIMRKH